MRATYRHDLGRAYQLAGDTAHAAPIFTQASSPPKPLELGSGAGATAQLQAMGVAAERVSSNVRLMRMCSSTRSDMVKRARNTTPSEGTTHS